jgi:hypothetical protein
MPKSEPNCMVKHLECLKEYVLIVIIIVTIFIIIFLYFDGKRDSRLNLL